MARRISGRAGGASTRLDVRALRRSRDRAESVAAVPRAVTLSRATGCRPPPENLRASEPAGGITEVGRVARAET